MMHKAKLPQWAHFQGHHAMALLPALALLLLVAALGVAPSEAQTGTGVTVPAIEIADDEDLGIFARLSQEMIDFQRRANAVIATQMNAIESGESLSAFFLGLAIAFAYGMVHTLGPGHGKFVIMSYFMGRDVRVMRGFIMAAQIAVIHVIAAIVIVWLADVVLKAGFGIGLADVPGVRAGSFLIIAAIGLYMLYQAVRTSLGYAAAGHGGSHGHSHSHSHGQSHGDGHKGSAESGLIALAAGMVPCPGAVLIMLYAVANDMIYPGFILVAAMSLGIGLTISILGVGAILARKTAMQLMESSVGGGGVATLRTTFNYGGAIIVTLIGLVSFVAFLDVPLALG